MTKFGIKFVICNYIDIFKQVNVEILIIVCVINFEIVFWQNNNDMTNHLTFAKSNLERNYSIIEENISAILCLKYLEI